MDAGRELDALVALQIFRYTLDYEFADTLGAPCVRELCDQYDEWGMLPHYSTEIGDAWLVVERVTRIPQSLAEAERAANTRFAYWFERTPLWSMSASEASLAICRAALAAYGVPS